VTAFVSVGFGRASRKAATATAASSMCVAAFACSVTNASQRKTPSPFSSNAVAGYEGLGQYRALGEPADELAANVWLDRKYTRARPLLRRANRRDRLRPPGGVTEPARNHEPGELRRRRHRCSSLDLLADLG
jgi:hypothetical protein